MPQRTATVFRVAEPRTPVLGVQSSAMISRGLKPGAAVIGLVASLLLLFATAPPASASSSLVVPLIRLTRSGLAACRAPFSIASTRS
jgi:hypothetical protein